MASAIACNFCLQEQLYKELREDYITEYGEDAAKEVERVALEELASYFDCSVNNLPTNLRSTSVSMHK